MVTGDPGTGKSDSVRWAADAVIRKFGAKGIALVINPAGLSDEHLGRSQKLTEELYTSIDMCSRKSITVTIYDDAESFFMSRRQSAESNDPTDVVKATIALLHGFDRLRFNPKVVQFATLNISGLIDPAILNRSDVVVRYNLPDIEARTAILARNLKGLAGERVLEKLAAQTQGKSGREINKINLHAYLHGTGPLLEDLTESDYLAAVGFTRTSNFKRNHEPCMHFANNKFQVGSQPQTRLLSSSTSSPQQPNYSNSHNGIASRWGLK
jgi:AAA+ superfamily predicted ATPase